MKRFAAIISSLTVCVAFGAQDWIRTGTGLGVEKIRLAVPDFKPAATDPDCKKLATTFSTTLWNDLQAAGIFDMVSAELLPVVRSGHAAGGQTRRLGRSASQCQHARLRQRRRAGRIAGCAGLAVRRQECAVAAGAGQAVPRDGHRRQCPPHRPPLRRRNHLPSRRRHPGHRGIQDLLRQQSRRHQRNLADGLRRRQPEAAHASRHHRVVAARFAGRFAHRLRRDVQRRVADPDVLAGAEPAGELSRALGAPTSRRHGRPMERRSRSPPPAPAIPRSMSSMSPAAKFARASPTPRAPTSRPPGIPRRTPRSPGSADAPVCRRSTPWHRTGRTSCA